MPLYDVACSHCGHHEEVYRTFANYEDLPLCCGENMQRMVCAPMVMGDIEPYISQATGEIIHSRSRHREHLRDHCLIEVGNETKYLTPKPYTSPPGLKETLIKVANEKLRS